MSLCAKMHHNAVLLIAFLGQLVLLNQFSLNAFAKVSSAVAN